MSTATVINRAFELTTPCSLKKGGGSTGRDPTWATHQLTSIHRRMNATAKMKYEGLSRKALMRSMSRRTPEICASSRSLNIESSSRLSFAEEDSWPAWPGGGDWGGD